MNKNTKYARSKGFASMWDMNNNGTKITKGACCNTARPAGKGRWMGAQKAAKVQGQSGD